jgi:hypothetical protein
LTAELEKKLKNSKGGAGGGPGTGTDQAVVDKCIEELNNLRAEFEAHRDYANQNLNQLNAEMPNKADKSDLVDLENRIMDKLKDMINQLLANFANKEDVMKRFAQLSKKIREIMENLANRGGATNEEDAMFSKKHLGPVACASCEKNLVNMHGNPADYHVWKKLPFRDPSERIARYGQGFSKILSHMRPSDILASAAGSPNRGGNYYDDSHVHQYQQFAAATAENGSLDNGHYKTHASFFKNSKA